MTQMRLAAPVRAGEPALDEHQRAAVARVIGGPGSVLVAGGTGTGKSTVAVAAVAGAIVGGLPAERVLLLAPTRHAAAALRDRVSAAIGRPTGTPVARTAQSAAFEVLSALAHAQGEPPPALITGAEQDVMLREILDGHLDGVGSVPDWTGVVPPEATRLPGFRDELRDVLMRAAELGMSPEQLEDLAREVGRPEWTAVAQAMRDYLNVTTLRSLPVDQGPRYDPAEVVFAAADALDGWEDYASTAAPSWDLVVIDDFQDGTIAVAALVRAVLRRGARVALVGNADQTVQGFRGAAPHAMVAALRSTGDIARHELAVDHRQPPALAAVSASLAQEIGVAGDASARQAVREAASTTPAPVTLLTVPHRYGQSRAVAQELRRAHHGLVDSPVPWSRMVVIARSGAQLRALRSDLLGASIPCDALRDGTALHDEPAVRPLLAIARCAVLDGWTVDDASAVLLSRAGGLDPVGLRRLRRALVREERAGGGERASDALLLDAMADPARLATLEGPEAVAAATVARAAQAAAKRASEPGPTPGAVLWAVWDALGVADKWRDQALAGSDRDDADLDAVIALLRAAQTFTERLPQARIGAFIEALESQHFAADTLGARAVGADAVAFATPASAAGGEWDVVVVAGVEEGVWPDLRLRDSVLGAQLLADHLSGRADARGQRDLHTARRAVLDDETRAMLVAVSRAKVRLIVTAIKDGESQPSRYLASIARAAGVTVADVASGRDVADLRGAVASLRAEGARSLERADARAGVGVAQDGAGRDGAGHDSATVEGAAEALARLAALGVPGANPAQWHGVPELSTAEGFWDPDVTVRVSPSRIDTIRTCGLKWALESVGGRPEATLEQNLGMLIHAIAEDLPAGTEQELIAALDERWDSMGGTDTWIDRREYQRARDMVVRFAKYVASTDAGRVEVERAFGVDVGRARIAGVADRVEIDGDEARIVDLKTGRPISVADAEQHGQLMLYQLAANLGGIEGVSRAVGASLVFLGTGVRPAVRTQPAFPVEQATAELDAVVDVMTASGFDARVNSMCGHCPVRRACPAHASGAQVTQS